MGMGITARICGLTVALLFAATAALAEGQSRDNTDKSAAAGSHRAAQDKGLDFSVDYDEMAKKNEERLKSEESEGEGQEGQAAAGSHRAAQDEDVPKGVDWSRRLGKNWRMDPVAMDRRQDGKQSDYNADVDNQVIGVEIRRPF